MKYTGWIIVLLLAIWGCDDDTAARCLRAAVAGVLRSAHVVHLRLLRGAIHGAVAPPRVLVDDVCDATSAASSVADPRAVLIVHALIRSGFSFAIVRLDVADVGVICVYRKTLLERFRVTGLRLVQRGRGAHGVDVTFFAVRISASRSSRVQAAVGIITQLDGERLLLAPTLTRTGAVFIIHARPVVVPDAHARVRAVIAALLARQPRARWRHQIPHHARGEVERPTRPSESVAR